MRIAGSVKSLSEAQERPGDFFLLQYDSTLGLYTAHTEIWRSIPSAGSACTLYPTFPCLTDLTSRLCVSWWTRPRSLHFCQESERFWAVLQSPHLVWSPKFYIERLSTRDLGRFFWFFRQIISLFNSKCIPHKSEAFIRSGVAYTLVSNDAAAFGLDRLCPSLDHITSLFGRSGDALATVVVPRRHPIPLFIKDVVLIFN